MFKKLWDRLVRGNSTDIVESEYLDCDDDGGLVRVQWVKCISHRTRAWSYQRRYQRVESSKWQNRGVSAWGEWALEKYRQLTATRADYELLAFIEG